MVQLGHPARFRFNKCYLNPTAEEKRLLNELNEFYRAEGRLPTETECAKYPELQEASALRNKYEVRNPYYTGDYFSWTYGNPTIDIPKVVWNTSLGNKWVAEWHKMHR